ncbi:MAG TPA: dihydroneopterin aldolase [Flavobacteriales bacterium]
MGLIEVNGIRVYAYHGCLHEEGRIGGHYRVDIAVEGDLTEAEASDRLGDTVDYSRITAIVQEEMGIRSQLIEHVARRILDHLKRQWAVPYQWRVRVVKEDPPIAGSVNHVVYTVAG